MIAGGGQDLARQVDVLLARLPPELHSRARHEAARLARSRVEEQTRRNRMGFYRDEPVRWARDRLGGVHLWSKQQEIINALRVHRKVAVPSCHDAGKSFVAAAAVAHWLDTHPPGSAFAITTAPTFPQVRAILWREIRRLSRLMNPPLGRVNQTEWLIDDDLVAFGRKPADHDEGGFQGIHAQYPLVVLDEAGGIPQQLWIAADSIATNENARILAIGNPDDPTSYFAQVCELPSWHVITIPAAETPAFTGEQIPDDLRQALLSRAWAEEKRREWGEDNPVYISKVLAQFPKDVAWKVIKASDVAKRRIGRDEPWPASKLRPVCLGVDVGEGRDWTVVRERRGVQAGREWQARTPEPEQAVKLIGQAVLITGAKTVNIDAGGPGWGIAAALRGWLKQHKVRGVAVNPIRFGAKSREPEKYLNMRAELWWGVGRLLSEQGGWDLSVMENADDTTAQLLDPIWREGAGDRIVIESKEELRKRTGRSPDNADALLLAFARRGGPVELESADDSGARLPSGPNGGRQPGRATTRPLTAML
ncbi:hypothetical protein FRAAL2741 [Frankia alni ACN14a]|uniref:Terminase n=1 Tax=Frankia alni (strain DSM 45986 / CECT 9034 / ACN14a) TaxID=326424 RepID=Q0RM67_FRAAA|nr:hypothetical protein [Frankia sp. ACN10a]CAJ61385.1 hypothetical protein FRAAL2741 [Frankia alni ACN14a]